MRTHLALLPLVLLLTACTDGESTSPIVDTAPVDTGWPSELVLMQDMSFTLTEEGINLSLTTTGWAAGITFNAYNTGVGDPATNGWDEEHRPDTTAQTTKDDLEGVTDNRLLDLEHVDSIIYWRRNETTLFNTDDSGSLTYAVRLYDGNENLSECLVWGHSPPNLYAGVYSKVNITSYPEQFTSTNCKAWTPSTE